MKKYILLFVVFLMLCSCDETVTFNNPSMQGLKDGVFWRAKTAKAYAAANGSVTIVGDAGNQVLKLITSSKNVQSYTLGKDAPNMAQYQTTIAGDAFNYETGSEAVSGQIIISEFDAVNNTISGSFKCTVSSDQGAPSIGPKISFKQGVFYKIPFVFQVP